MTSTATTGTEQTTTPRHFDVIIIGTGSGNFIPNPAYHPVSIALIEEARFGGTCLNVGCIPTKMFVLAADAARNIREAARLGVHGTFDSVDLKQIQQRVFEKRVDPIADAGEAYRRGPKTPNIEVFDRHASFVGPRAIRTGQGEREEIITADNIILAAGSRAFIPPVVEESGVRYYTNKDIMRIEELPHEMIILGGGYIATEFAHVFSSFGVKVHVIVRSGAMLRGSDESISARFTEVASRDWDVHLNTTVTALSESDGTVTATLSDGTTLDADALLVATGRVPNGDRMNLAAGGVEMHADGRVKVDEFGRTTAEGVWALGDVSSPYQLKHIANHEAKVVFHNVLNQDNLRKFNHNYVPSAVFSHPQVGQVGMTEAEARAWAQANGTSITVKIQNIGDVAYGWALEDTDGFAKLIADRSTGRLLGAHFIGEQAATLVQQCIQMMNFDMDVREVVTGQHWIHPALPEVIENAILGLEFD
nr:mycothione reductase [Corynebacterium lactis]